MEKEDESNHEEREDDGLSSAVLRQRKIMSSAKETFENGELNSIGIGKVLLSFSDILATSFHMSLCDRC